MQRDFIVALLHSECRCKNNYLFFSKTVFKIIHIPGFRECFPLFFTENNFYVFGQVSPLCAWRWISRVLIVQKHYLPKLLDVNKFWLEGRPHFESGGGWSIKKLWHQAPSGSSYARTSKYARGTSAYGPLVQALHLLRVMSCMISTNVYPSILIGGNFYVFHLFYGN